MGPKCYAVAVKEEDGTLYLVLRIRRSRKDEIFRMWPGRGKRDPHTSYHSNGQMHQKSYGHEHLVWKKQKPGDPSQRLRANAGHTTRAR